MEGKTMAEMNPSRKANKRLFDSAEKGLMKKLGNKKKLMSEKMVSQGNQQVTYLGKK